MKRFFSLITILLIAVTVLSGCGGGSKVGGKSHKYGLSEYEPKKDVKYDITWTASQAAPVSDNADILKYHNDKYNVNIKILNIDQKNYDQQISLKFAANEVPDIIRVNSSTLLARYQEQDVLAKIPVDVLEKYAPNLWNEYKKVDSSFFDKIGGFIDNDLYGINILKDRGKYHPAIVYRGDWMKKVGVDKAPANFEEFESLMYKFAKEDPDGNGKNDTYGLSNYGMQVVYGMFGYVPSNTWPNLDFPNVNWQKKDDKLVYAAVQPEMKGALKILSKWYQDGILDPEFITGENNPNNAQSFINGRIGFTVNGIYANWIPQTKERKEIPIIRSELSKSNPTAANSLVFAEPPVGSTGLKGVRQEQVITSVYVGFGKQLESTPDKFGKILQVIDEICFKSSENVATAWFGMKGTDWDFNSEGIPDTLGKSFNASETSKRGGHTQLIIFKSLDKWKLPSSSEKWLTDNYFNQDGIQDALYKGLPSEGKYLSELQKLQTDAYISIIKGEKPIEYFDEFVNKWNQNGGETLTKEANSN